MYQIKAIVSTDDDITLPQCMYYLKNPNNMKIEEVEINISDQVKRFLKEAPKDSIVELEYRQNQLLQKLDVLYERIQAISTLCQGDVKQNAIYNKNEKSANPKEIVIVLNPGILPGFVDIFFKDNPEVNVTWHIHSSVLQEKSIDIKKFFDNKSESLKVNAQTNIRLIFKCVSASAELRTSSLHLPVLGIVNTIRYLCLLFPNIIKYDQNDYYVDSLLDQCYLLEKVQSKKEIVDKIFSQSKNWIYKNELSIVDLVAYIVINLLNISKLVPKTWYNRCSTTFL